MDLEELDLIAEEDEFQGDDEEERTPKKPHRKTEKKDKPVKRFLCSVTGCPYTTPYKKDLVRHMRKHTGEKPYTCELCSKQFSRYDKLMAHTRVHEGLRSHHCNYPSCTYSSIDSSALRRHVARIHSDEKPYMCQLCPYRAKNSTQMNIHVRFHTGDSPYICSLCPRAFKTSTDLQRHCRIHSQDKPFVCSDCPFTTSHKCNLTVHIKRKHLPLLEGKASVIQKNGTRRQKDPDGSQETKAQLPFALACKFCKFKTETIKSFKLHMVKGHKTTNYDSILDQFAKPTKKQRQKLLLAGAGSEFAAVFRCNDPDCAASFVSDKSLRCHMRQHVTLHPPPAPTVEIIISSAASESETRFITETETITGLGPELSE